MLRYKNNLKNFNFICEKFLMLHICLPKTGFFTIFFTVYFFTAMFLIFNIEDAIVLNRTSVLQTTPSDKVKCKK